MNLNHLRNTKAASRSKRTRHITLSALSIAVLALALIITGMLATGSASAQTTNADGSKTIWSTTITVGKSTITTGTFVQENAGYDSSLGSIGSTQFTYSGTTYSIARIRTLKETTSGNVITDALSLGMPSLLPTASDSKLVLELNGTRFPLSEASRSGNSYEWASPGLTWATNDSVTVKLVELQAPASAPTNLTTTTPSTTQIGLAWSAPSMNGGSPITGYKIEVSTDAGNNWTVLIADTDSTLTTHAPSGFVPGDTRHFRVSAINNIGTGAASGTASDTATRVKESNTEDLLWTAKLTTAATTGFGGSAPGYSNLTNPNEGSITSTAFIYGGNNYAINFFGITTSEGSCTPTGSALQIWASPGDWDNSDTSWVLHVDSDTYNFADADERTSGEVDWCGVTASDLGWVGGDTVTLKIVGPSAPSVSSIALTSDPNDDSRSGNDNTYAIGDDIDVAITFSESADITGSPQVTLLIGSSEKNATCTAATGTTTLACSYEVTQGDNAPDGVGIKAKSLALNGGTIRKAGSTTVNADLFHGGVTANSQHKVDGIRPTLITTGSDAPRTSVDGTQVFLRFSEPLSSTDFGSLSISISSGSGVTGAPTSATINNGNRVTVTHTGVVTEDSGVSLTISANAVKDLVGNTFNQRRFVPITNNARVPVAPTTLTATAASTTKINLSWSAPSDAAETNVTGYKIEVSTDAGNNWTDLVADTNSTDTKYAHTGLEPDDTRHYRVSAINAVGASPVSNVVSATTLRVNPVVSSGEGTLFVANTGSGNNQDGELTQYQISRRAQAFTTGPASAGYVLGSIGIRFSGIANTSTAASDLEVTLNERASNGNPGSTLCTLNDPAAFDDHAVNTFTAPSSGDAVCPILQGSTTYFVVVKRVSGGASTLRLTLTSRDEEDPEQTAKDWSIANQSRWFRSGNSTWTPRTEVLKLDIRGEYVPSLTAIDASADESGDPNSSTTMTFQIYLDQKVRHTVSVDYTTKDGTAKAGVNYTHTSGTVTFAPREQVQTVDVDILDDGEGGSTYFKFVLSNPKGAGLRNNSPGTGRIFDTSPRFRTWDETGRENNNGTDSTMSFVVEFDHRPAGDTADYTVDYRTEAITATAGSDYESTSGTLTFSPTDGDKQVTVTIKDDDIRDNGETFRLALSNPSSGTTLHRTAATAIGTILNHDSGGLTATFPTSAYASKSHKGPTDRPQVVVAFNSAVASISKTTPSVQVNGASITSVQTHTEDGLQNAQIFILEPDGNEDITFTLVANVACDSGGICNQSGTPLTQVPSAHTVPAKESTAETSQLSVSDATASEEDDTTIDFVVSLNPASDETVSVNYATANGTAAAGDDYTAKTGTITFNAGETTKTIQVSIIDDTIDDDNETFTLTLSSPYGAQISDATGTGTITNSEPVQDPPVEDPPAQDPVVLLTASFANVPADHNGDNFTFQLTFSENVEAGYARIRDEAFTVNGATIASASRQTQGSNQGWHVEVDPTGNEAVTITLPETTDCNAARAICTDDERKLSHATSEIVAGPPAISVSDANVQEAEGAVLEFSVTLSHPSSRTVTVDYATADGTATAGSDYTAASGSLTFNAGDTSQTVEVAVLTDSDDESEETLTVTLSSASQASLDDATGTGTILNGEAAGTQEDPPADDPPADDPVVDDPVVLVTASFSGMPATHDGTSFTFELDFSENVAAGYARIRDHAFTINGGDTINRPEITSAVRKVQGSNQGWTITVNPNGATDITITLPPTTDCDADGAICTSDGRMLSNSTSIQVAGPQ